MICPLLSIGHRENKDCEKENCELWIKSLKFEERGMQCRTIAGCAFTWLSTLGRN